MANGIPCQWCGFMEASHKAGAAAVHGRSAIPCDDYAPLEPIFMREIDRAAARCASYARTLPLLGSNYRFTRRALHVL